MSARSSFLRPLTGPCAFEQEGRMRVLVLLLLLLAFAACAPTQRDDQLELTYYYLRF